MKQWYAVYTRPTWEKKVAKLFDKKGFQNYSPLNKIVLQLGDRRKIAEEPLFKSYVFICIEESESSVIRKTDGVINFVYWLGQPAVIKAEEIAAIRDFLCHHTNAKLERISFRQLDKENNGPVLSHKDYNTGDQFRASKLILSSLGYALVAEPTMESAEVEVIDSSLMPLFKKPSYYYGAAVR